MNCRKERYRCCWLWKLGTNRCAGNCWPNRRPISCARPQRPVIRRSISRPEEETSTWCGYWWITGQRWTCKTYEKRALLSPRKEHVSEKRILLTVAGRRADSITHSERGRRRDSRQIFLRRESVGLHHRSPGSHAHASGCGERARFHHRAARRQIQSEHIRKDEGRIDVDAHSVVERALGMRDDAVQEGSVLAHAE